jgi:hypothetical protein
MNSLCILHILYDSRYSSKDTEHIDNISVAHVTPNSIAR